MIKTNKIGLGRAKQLVWGFGFALPRLIPCPQEKIRYEEKSSISVDGFVFQHHPDNIDHLSSETNKRLALGFAFTDLSLEVYTSFVITHA